MTHLTPEGGLQLTPLTLTHTLHTPLTHTLNTEGSVRALKKGHPLMQLCHLLTHTSSHPQSNTYSHKSHTLTFMPPSMSSQVPMWWSALWDTLKGEQSLIVSTSSLHTHIVRHLQYNGPGPGGRTSPMPHKMNIKTGGNIMIAKYRLFFKRKQLFSILFTR